MTQLEIDQQTAQKLEALSKQTRKSVDEVLLWLLNNYGHTIIQIDESETQDESIWTEAELKELLQPQKPLTGEEIVEKHLASGVIGSWGDESIEDGADWVNLQKARHQGKYRW